MAGAPIARSVAGLAVLAAGCDAFSSAFLAPALRAPSLSQAACSSPQLAGSAVRGRARGMGLRMQNGIDIPLGDDRPGAKKTNAAGAAGGAAAESEIFLAELAFSNPMDLPKIVERNLNKLDDKFYVFLDSKIKSTVDGEEKETLELLREAVTDLMQKILKAAVDRGDVNKDDLRAAGLAGGLSEVSEASAMDMALATYDQLIDRCLADPNGVDSAAEVNYDRIDMRFLERLTERIQEAEGDKQSKLNRLNGAIQGCMSDRISKASAALQNVLKGGTPDGMKKQLMLLNAKGGLDESVVLLLEANIDQARKAGAEPAAQVMTMLKEKALEYKDSSLPDEIRLIRQLLRTDDVDARETLMTEAFRPKEKMIMPDGTDSKIQSVSGKKFVNALRDMIEKYGNVEDKFLQKINMIAAESEKVASELFGLEKKDIGDLQDEAFNKRSISVWELESLEESYDRQGTEVPWHQAGKGGWDEDGNMVIGGTSFQKGGGAGGGEESSKIMW